MLCNLLGPALGAGLLLSGLFATPASALELAMGGTFYVSVLEGDCPQPIDLWGVGPGRNPLFLGHYQGRVSKRPPIYMGAYKSGQELYIWHETNDPGTGERRSQDIKSADAYKISVDPRGGYLIELKGATAQADAGLKMWVYPGKPPVSTPVAANDTAQVGDTLGSVVVNPSPAKVEAAPKAATAAVEAPMTAPKKADPTGTWQWPLLQAAIAGLLFVSYKRSRQVALAAGDIGPVSIGQVDVQSFGRHDEHAHAFQATPATPAAVAAPIPSVALGNLSTDDPAVAFSGPLTAPAAKAPAPAEAVADWTEQTAAAPQAKPAKKAAPGSPHYSARAPEGWSPLPSEGTTEATRETPAMPAAGATPAHAPVHGAVRAVARPAAKAPEAAPSAGLLEQLGRHRPMGLPLAFIGARPAKPAAVHDHGALTTIKRALAAGFHDLDLLHSDEEILVLSGLDLAQRRRVSIHALTPALAKDEKLSAQFLRDAQGFAALAHKGLLKVHRVSADPTPHYVAEALPGQPLSAALVAGQPLPLHEVLGAGTQITEALDHLHQRGMVHGDVRPSRVAGLSHDLKLCPPMLTAAGAERRLYRPPEAAHGAADYRGDLFSAGLMLHHMITGALPAGSGGDEPSVDHHKYRAAVPENLVTLIRRCLHADPARRYQDSGMARQMLEAMFREHAVRDRVVLSCLPGLARAVRTTLQPLGALMTGMKAMTADEVAQAVLEPKWRDTFKTRLTAKDGMAAIAVLIERGHGLKRWSQEAGLWQRVERLGRMGLELAGLHTLIESGGPRHPSVAERLRGEVIRLGEDIAAFETAVQGEVTARLVEFAGVVKDAVGVSATVEVDMTGVAAGLRGLFAEPATVRLQLVNALATAFAAAKANGAAKVEVAGSYDEGFKRVVVVVADDGHAVPATVVRPPTAIVSRLTRAAAPTERAAVRELEHTYEAMERLGGRVMVSNRDGAPGVELRIELPSNLC